MSPAKRPPNEPDPASNQPKPRAPLRSRKAVAKKTEPTKPDVAEPDEPAAAKKATGAAKKTATGTAKKATGAARKATGAVKASGATTDAEPVDSTPHLSATPPKTERVRRGTIGEPETTPRRRRAAARASSGGAPPGAEPKPTPSRRLRPPETPSAAPVLSQFELPSPNDPGAGIPRGFTRYQWLVKGFGRQGPATTVALLAGWTGLVVALWAAAIGAILGALIGVGLIATSSFTRSLFHAGAGQAVTFVGIVAGALAGAGGSFTAIYATSLFGNPTRVAVTLFSGLVVATALVVIITFTEPTLLRMRGYRRLSRDETRRIAPLVHQAARGLGLKSLPTFAMADLQVPRAWTHTRTVVLSKGMLDLLEDDELRAVLTHELYHWAVGDGVALRLVWACAWPIAIAYNVGAWLSGRDLNSEKPQHLPRGFIGWIGWFLLWPTWLLANAVIAPLVAARQRKNEYEADRAALRTGDGPALSSALLKVSAFEAGRTGWEYAMTRHHPPTELRREALQPRQTDDDEYQQEELGALPSGLVENAALVLVVVLIVLGGVINHNRANAGTTPSPITSGLGGPGPTVGTPGSIGTPPTPAVTATTLPSVASVTARFPHTRSGATNAAASFTAALAKSVFEHAKYAALIHASGGPAAPALLEQEIDTVWQQRASALAGHSVATSASGVSTNLTEYDLDPAGDRAFVDTSVTLNYTVDGQPLRTQISGRFVLVWFQPDGWKVTDIASFTPVG